MAILSSNLILTLTTTYLLITILVGTLIVRVFSLRRARTTYSPLSLRGLSGILVWTAGIFTVAYAILGTWWWVKAENYMKRYLSQGPTIHIHVDQAPAVGGGTPSTLPGVPVFMRDYNGGDLYTRMMMVRPPVELVSIGVGAEMALVMGYVVVVWAVKGVFLCLIREGWVKLKGVARGVWWVAVGVVGASFVGVVVGGAAIVGMSIVAGDVYYPLDFITRQLVVIVGITHILVLLLVILTGILALRCLSPHFPPSIPPHHTTFLFATAFLSILFTIFRLFANISPTPRASFISILSMGELVLLAAISCLPSTVIARASSLHGHLTLVSHPPSPSARGGHDRNFRHLSVLTEKTRVTARDFGYRVDHVPLSSHAQGDLDDPSRRIPSAPLFVDPELDRYPRKPEKVQLKPTWDEKDAGIGIGVSDGSSEEESSSDEEAGRQRWISGRRSGARISGLRSGFEEGRDWRSGGGDEVHVYGGLRELGSAGERWRTPRTPRRFV